MNIDLSKPVEIANSIFWVGIRGDNENLTCNPYLIRNGSNSVLIDPGSKLDFEGVLAKVQSLVSLKDIPFIIIQHQDPDLVSSIPLFEAAGITCQVATHWRTSVIAKYYGFASPFYLVNSSGYRLPSGVLDSIRFIPTPYLHFPGAIATFEADSGTLFSSDLFGAFMMHKGVNELYANETYIEAMKSFHEHYMPSNDILRPVMEGLLNIDIKRIAPQHGSIITRNCREHIIALRDLECGSFITTIRKELTESGGYTGICNKVLLRLISLSSISEIIELFEGSPILLDPQSGAIVDFNVTGKELWNQLFEIIYTKRGVAWLTPLEIFVRELSSQYTINLPSIFESAFLDLSKQASQLSSDIVDANKRAEQLAISLKQAQEQITLDQTTGLYNATFFRQYCDTLLKSPELQGAASILISIDDLQRFNFIFGNQEGTLIVKGIASLLKTMAPQGAVYAKMEGALFNVIFINSSKDSAVQWAEKFRNEVQDFNGFIEPVTVSIGVVHTSEVSNNFRENQVFEQVYSLAGHRVRIAKKRGMNYVCSESSISEIKECAGKILLIDMEQLSVDVLKTIFDQMSLEVKIAFDGDQALNILESYEPDIVISELSLPKMDGFIVRERMQYSSKTSAIPFIITTHIKNETTIQRAQELGIVHYFRKPYILSELIGIVKLLLRHREAVV